MSKSFGSRIRLCVFKSPISMKMLPKPPAEPCCREQPQTQTPNTGTSWGRPSLGCPGVALGQVGGAQVRASPVWRAHSTGSTKREVCYLVWMLFSCKTVSLVSLSSSFSPAHPPFLSPNVNVVALSTRALSPRFHILYLALTFSLVFSII